MSKPIICVAFDGVIHSYERGWQDGVIYGTVVPGFFEWLEVVQEHFEIVVYSSRSRSNQGVAFMHKWMLDQYQIWQANISDTEVNMLYLPVTFAYEKPPAFLTIDDRAIRFEGNWEAPELSLEALRNFTPWMMR